MRLLVARCEVTYSGRLTTRLPEAVRLLMFKSDGTFMVWSDGGGQTVKPQNWMTAPTTVEEHGDPLERIVVRKARTDDRLDIVIADVLSDVTHDMGEAFALGDRLGVLQSGRLIACDTPARIAASLEPAVRLFLDAMPTPGTRRHTASHATA